MRGGENMMQISYQDNKTTYEKSNNEHNRMRDIRFDFLNGSFIQKDVYSMVSSLVSDSKTHLQTNIIKNMVHDYYDKTVDIDISQNIEDSFTYVRIYDRNLSFEENLIRYEQLDKFSHKKNTPWVFLIGG